MDQRHMHGLLFCAQIFCSIIDEADANCTQTLRLLPVSPLEGKRLDANCALHDILTRKMYISEISCWLGKKL